MLTQCKSCTHIGACSIKDKAVMCVCFEPKRKHKEIRYRTAYLKTTTMPRDVSKISDYVYWQNFMALSFA